MVVGFWVVPLYRGSSLYRASVPPVGLFAVCSLGSASGCSDFSSWAEMLMSCVMAGWS